MLESRKTQNSIIQDVGCSGDDGKMAMGKKGFRKVKQAMFYPFRMAKKQILRPKVKRVFSSSISNSRNGENSSDKRGFDGSVKYQGCGFCLPKLCISDSTNGSPTDPNHRKFTNEMLRVLIQNNDFYSKQCNPHLGV